ncbi:hypothetical protein GYMLUDRAFT_382459 [Collybiopsis luxurians FD-317 M1]|nr:hypothetical protein GYMLUDRAFT_382459 [Collybiopsis luxurians FD-317 M1]
MKESFWSWKMTEYPCQLNCVQSAVLKFTRLRVSFKGELIILWIRLKIALRRRSEKKLLRQNCIPKVHSSLGSHEKLESFRTERIRKSTAGVSSEEYCWNEFVRVNFTVGKLADSFRKTRLLRVRVGRFRSLFFF